MTRFDTALGVVFIIVLCFGLFLLRTEFLKDDQATKIWKEGIEWKLKNLESDNERLRIKLARQEARLDAIVDRATTLGK